LTSTRTTTRPRLDDKIDGVELTPEQAESYRILAGSYAYAMVLQFATLPGFDDLPIKARQEIVKGRVEAGRAMAKQQFLMDNTDLYMQVLTKNLEDPVVKPLFEE
jgi:hypothetical protein